ncbi:hypothetical protein ACFL21_00395 [Patescibacteria group bacterium]
MKFKLKTQITIFLSLLVILLIQFPATYAEVMVYSNEIDEVNANKTILDNNDTGGNIILQFGNTLNEQLYWDDAIGTFIFTDDLQITGNLDVDGTITTGSGNITITDATGNIDGDQIADNTVDDDSIDFGMDVDQVGADDISMADNFDNSDGTNVQTVTDDIDASIGDRTYTEDNYLTDGEPVASSLDSLDQELRNVADATASQEGTPMNIFTLDDDDSGGVVQLVFGTTVSQYLSHDGTQFNFSDDLRMIGDAKVEFRDGELYIYSSIDGQLDIDADTEVEITAPTVDLDGDLDVSGSITGATIDGDDNTIQDIDWDSMDTRTKKIVIDINDVTIKEDGSNNYANVYIESETGTNGHEYYVLKTIQGNLQDLDLKIKVRVPEDFIDFTTAVNDIGLWYKNTGIDSSDSKIDILIEDDEGDDAFDAVDGQGLFNTDWTAYVDEFDGAGFDPVAGEYIYITIKGYTSNDAGYHSPYIGEIAFTYTGK